MKIDINQEIYIFYPALMSKSVYPVCPSMVAWCSGPLPFKSTWLTLAPFCRRNSQAAKEFCREKYTVIIHRNTHAIHTHNMNNGLTHTHTHLQPKRLVLVEFCCLQPHWPSWHRRHAPEHLPWEGNAALPQIDTAKPRDEDHSDPPLHHYLYNRERESQ